MLNYRVDRIRVIGSAAFAEASKEELRALLSLIELDGKIESEGELAEAAKISTARCKAALAFWEESGVICIDDGRPLIIEEFEERVLRAEITEVPAKQVADSIRNECLASMIDECAMLMKQACLPDTEVKILTGLCTQYALDPAFIATLAAHLAAQGKLTIHRLRDEAIKLQSKGCDTVESLEIYITTSETSSGVEWEFRRVLGIYNRNLSPSERAFFKKWSEDFGYSVNVVGEAYDIAVLNTKTGRGDLRYMDTILTAWHEAGCKTVNECRAHSESERAKRLAEQSARVGAKGRSKSTPEAPRYGNFDINEAFNNAVARSFGEENDNEGEEN